MAYARGVASGLRALLGEELVGAYVGGSLALGDHEPGRSDVDVTAVCRRPLPHETKQRIGAALRHEVLPCPGRGLELVVYAEPTVSVATTEPGYELDLNTGTDMPFRLVLGPSGEGGTHWYALDREILREHGVALLGPPPRELFAPLPRSAVLGLLLESLRWHVEDDAALPEDAVLNACRAWRYSQEGTWSSKVAAARWVSVRLPDARGVVDDALRARRGGEQPTRHRVATFLQDVRGRIEDARASAEPSYP